MQRLHAAVTVFLDARPPRGDRRRQKLQKCHRRFSKRAAVSPPPSPLQCWLQVWRLTEIDLIGRPQDSGVEGRGRKLPVKVEVTMDVSRHFCNFCRLLSRSCVFPGHVRLNGLSPTACGRSVSEILRVPDTLHERFNVRVTSVGIIHAICIFP